VRDRHPTFQNRREKAARRKVLIRRYFGVEFAVALSIGSVSLFAYSVDFLGDASVNFLILMALGWSVRSRARVGMALAAILVPAIATIWTAWQKFAVPAAPEPFALSLTGLGALVDNLSCALLLARFRHHSGSRTKAAFLSARNDAIASGAGLHAVPDVGRIAADYHWLELLLHDQARTIAARDRLEPPLIVEDFPVLHFVAMVIEVHARLTPRGKNSLQGRLRSALTAETGFAALHLEMDVARRLFDAGFDVEFPDLAGTA
jgi:hypothetical protein